MTLVASDRIATAAPASSIFPALGGDGPRFDPTTCKAPGTAFQTLAAWLVAVPVMLVATLITYGVFLIAAIAGLIYDFVYSRRIMATLRGSSVEVGPKQLPQVHACVAVCAERLGMKRAPAVFVVQEKSLNAMAMRVGSRSVVILLDEVVDACLRSGDPRTLTFIVGHELGHHALGHTGRLRSYLRRIWKRLSRLDELSCDNVAMRLVGDPGVAARALTILIAGPALLPFLDPDQLMAQAREVANDGQTKKAEKRLSHPLLLRRLSRCI